MKVALTCTWVSTGLSLTNWNACFLFFFSYTTHQVVCISNINFQRKSVVVSFFPAALRHSSCILHGVIVSPARPCVPPKPERSPASLCRPLLTLLLRFSQCGLRGPRLHHITQCSNGRKMSMGYTLVVQVAGASVVFDNLGVLKPVFLGGA